MSSIEGPRLATVTKKQKALDPALIMALAAVELPEMPLDPPANRISLGWVAINRKTLKGSSGAQYSAGCKAYKSEAIAKAAIQQRYDINDYYFTEAFAEVPDEVLGVRLSHHK
jgi:hypothetical protein